MIYCCRQIVRNIVQVAFRYIRMINNCGTYLIFRIQSVRWPLIWTTIVQVIRVIVRIRKARFVDAVDKTETELKNAEGIAGSDPAGLTAAQKVSFNHFRGSGTPQTTRLAIFKRYCFRIWFAHCRPCTFGRHETWLSETMETRVVVLSIRQVSLDP